MRVGMEKNKRFGCRINLIIVKNDVGIGILKTVRRKILQHAKKLEDLN